MSRKIELKYNVLKPLVSIAIAYAIAIAIIGLVSKQPGTAIATFIVGPLRSTRSMANVIEMMIPFVFTGLGIAVMQKASQFNVVGEGVFFLTGAVGAYIALNTALPAVLSPAFIILACGLVGSIIALVPAVLKVKFKANELVSSIMLNYVLLNLGLYMMNYTMRDIAAGFNASFKLPLVSKLPVLLPGTRIHAGALVAAVVVVLVSYLMFRTRFGYELGVVGENENFARYSGIRVTRVVLLVQALGGFLAGMGGSVELLGLYQRFQWETLTGYGFDGVVVATIARRNPLLVPLSAFFLAYMRTGADIVSRRTDIPVEFVNIIQAIALILVAAQMLLEKARLREIVAASRKTITAEV